MRLEHIKHGTRLRVRQSVVSPSRGLWTTTTEGTFLQYYKERRSVLQNWFAHSESGQLPLMRLRILLDDGSITDLVLQRDVEIEVLSKVTDAGAV
ncbi:MAG: hypothetical protein B6D36_13950 [Planctomycetes bacterium UTPLA1]|jgi:hypothetical protein|nr:MAG: hypothetical protein B6D36_13950 [Planctomycetes bacterium UTPLA1]